MSRLYAASARLSQSSDIAKTRQTVIFCHDIGARNKLVYMLGQCFLKDSTLHTQLTTHLASKRVIFTARCRALSTSYQYRYML